MAGLFFYSRSRQENEIEEVNLHSPRFSVQHRYQSINSQPESRKFPDLLSLESVKSKKSQWSDDLADCMLAKLRVRP